MTYWSNYSRSCGLSAVKLTPEKTHKREVIDGLVYDRVVREIPQPEYVPYLSRTLGVLLASGQPIERVPSDVLTEDRFESINNINYVSRETKEKE